MQAIRTEMTLGASTLSLETGKLAKQAHSVVVRQGDTMVLVAAVEGGTREGQDFFPLTVDYREKVYAAGRFPGGYIKREGRPSLKETLTSRLIDRPLRPLFPTGYFNEVQVICTVLSADRENDPDVLALIGASAALHISPMPFAKPVAAVRVGRVNGQFIVQPTVEQMETSDLDLIVAGTADHVTMIEGFARELPEDIAAEAIDLAHSEIKRVVTAIEQFRTAAGFGAKTLPPVAPESPLVGQMAKKFGADLKAAKLIKPKLERYAAVKAVKTKIMAEFAPPGVEGAAKPGEVKAAIGVFEENVFRDITLAGKRIDGRDYNELRALYSEAGTLPRTHGSALFQRGETQALVIATLGTVADEQKIEGLMEDVSKKFMLDYNFPPFSVGECKPMRGPGRREFGHGALAERSLKAVLPPPSKFPYTIRLVSEILESNGSSSMASVCGGTLALMDAGVPIKQPVAGISIGLVKTSDDDFVLLTDIQGDEDHYGDMDFKIAGTQNGVTGIQLDIKVDGISGKIVRAALAQAKAARVEILKAMLSALRKPRETISMFAPRMLSVKINPEKIGLLIGPGGKTIRGIQEATGAKIDISDDGNVTIAHSDAFGAEEAKKRIDALTKQVEIGTVYDGKVTSVKEFGAFVELTPGKDGLVHISELDHYRVQRVEDVCRVGDRMQVKVIAIDDQDRVKLSRKALLPMPDGSAPANGSGGGGDRSDRPERADRGERRR